VQERFCIGGITRESLAGSNNLKKPETRMSWLARFMSYASGIEGLKNYPRIPGGNGEGTVVRSFL
jgi:hypothetical protein